MAAQADIILQIKQRGVQDLRSMALGFVSLSGAIAGATRTAQVFEDAFRFKATLDANNRAIAVQLRGVRDVGQAFQEARAYGAEYKLTQEQITGALQSSVGVLRQSRSSVSDTLSTLQRLQILSPEQSIAGAALALKELASGSTSSLVTRFEVSRSKARAMKEEIEGGADAVQVLSKYLDNAGVSMDALKVQTEGAAGKLRDLDIAKERATRALAGEGGPGSVGATIVDLQTEAYNRFANLLSRDVITSLRETARANYVAGQAQLAYNEAIRQGKTEAEARQAQEERYRQEAERTASLQEQVANAITAAADAARAAAPASDDLANAHLRGARGAFAQAAALGELTRQISQEGKAPPPEIIGVRASQDAADAKAKREADRNRFLSNIGGVKEFADELTRQHQAQLQLDLARAKTDQQRIAILQQELARTTDVVDRLNLQAQIEQLRNSSARSHTSELGKQLRLNESIYDSQQKQYKAALDAQLLANDDAKQRILEADKAQRLQNTIANAKDPRFRALAQLELDRIPLEQAKRAFDLNQQIATAGGTIGPNGKLLQSVPGGAALPPTTSTAAPGLPGAVPGLPGGMGGTLIQVFIDGEEISYRMAVKQLNAARASRGAQGGRPPA